MAVRDTRDTTTMVRRDTAAPPGQRASLGEDAVTVLLGFWFTGGLLLDAWAHTNIIKTLESFYTPWHAVFYGGFVALAGWTLLLAYRRRDRAPRWWRDGWPAGYRAGAIGAVFFLAAGLGDLVWHAFYGVEDGFNIALSPTHMILTASGVWLVTAATRSWWAHDTGGLRAAFGVIALALGTVFATVLLTYYSAFVHIAATQPYDNKPNGFSETTAVRGAMSYMITTTILVIPLLLAHRRRTTPGLATALVGTFYLFDMIMFEFPAPQTGAGLMAVAGAVVVDIILVRLDAARGFGARYRLPIAGAVFATVVWCGHILGLAIFRGHDIYPADNGVMWHAEIWTGAVAISALLAGVFGDFLSKQPLPAHDRKPA